MRDGNIHEQRPEDRISNFFDMKDDILAAVIELSTALWVRPDAQRISQPDAQLAEAMAVIDAHRARRLERRLANLPVECERRHGVDRRCNK